MAFPTCRCEFFAAAILLEVFMSNLRPPTKVSLQGPHAMDPLFTLDGTIPGGCAAVVLALLVAPERSTAEATEACQPHRLNA